MRPSFKQFLSFHLFMSEWLALMTKSLLLFKYFRMFIRLNLYLNASDKMPPRHRRPWFFDTDDGLEEFIWHWLHNDQKNLFFVILTPGFNQPVDIACPDSILFSRDNFSRITFPISSFDFHKKSISCTSYLTPHHLTLLFFPLINSFRSILPPTPLSYAFLSLSLSPLLSLSLFIPNHCFLFLYIPIYRPVSVCLYLSLSFFLSLSLSYLSLFPSLSLSLSLYIYIYINRLR